MTKVIDQAEILYFSNAAYIKKNVNRNNVVRIKKGNIISKDEFQEGLKRIKAVENLIDTIFAEKPAKPKRKPYFDRKVVDSYDGVPIYTKR